MDTAVAVPSFADRSLGEIATSLPGATAVFRRHKLDFCCGGAVSLAEAAARKGLPLERLTEELAALDPAAVPQAPEDPAALIDHILSRYHQVHRRELPELIRLSRRVETVHREHPQVPAGLAAALEAMLDELEQHMQKEEQILFPMLRRGGHPFVAQPIARMRAEHGEHGQRLRLIEQLSHGAVPPAEACPTWRALYAGVRKLGDDLMEHIHLENNLLFPAFIGEDAQA
jgi:regulator of cell morphogenesis and NO signaling